MTAEKKNPGSALQRATGADRELEMEPQFPRGAYVTRSEIQYRHVMWCCSVGRRIANVIAALFFGEGR